MSDDPLSRAHQEIERLISERDAARRELAMLLAPTVPSALTDFARQRGWDCFDVGVIDVQGH
jgi:hypothetical protein